MWLLGRQIVKHTQTHAYIPHAHTDTHTPHKQTNAPTPTYTHAHIWQQSNRSHLRFKYYGNYFMKLHNDNCCKKYNFIGTAKCFGWGASSNRSFEKKTHRQPKKQPESLSHIGIFILPRQYKTMTWKKVVVRVTIYFTLFFHLVPLDQLHRPKQAPTLEAQLYW